MFSFLFKRSVKVSGKVASRRLKQLLMADRVSCPAEIRRLFVGGKFSGMA